MALFSNKIIDARYMNAEYSIVEILYTGDDGNVYSHALEVDENSSDWKDLEHEGWTGEKLIQGTAKYKRQSSGAWNTEVMAAANILARSIAEEMIGTRVIQEEKEKLLSEVEKTKNKIESSKIELLDLDKTVKIKNKSINSELYDHLLDKNDNKEELFKCKLWALELDVVKSSAKDIKSSIRKAKRITQIISIVNDLIK